MTMHKCEVSGIEFETRDSEWEMIADEAVCPTQRLKVPGGWLYRTGFEGGISMCFVPEPDKCQLHTSEYFYKACASCQRKEKDDLLDRSDLP